LGKVHPPGIGGLKAGNDGGILDHVGEFRKELDHIFVDVSQNAGG
jgi:hypothetical protein